MYHSNKEPHSFTLHHLPELHHPCFKHRTMFSQELSYSLSILVRSIVEDVSQTGLIQNTILPQSSQCVITSNRFITLGSEEIFSHAWLKKINSNKGAQLQKSKQSFFKTGVLERHQHSTHNQIMLVKILSVTATSAHSIQSTNWP